MRVSANFVLPFVALAVAQSSTNSPLVDLISSQADLSTLLSILSISPDLVATLGNASNITIFAPANGAFAAIPANSTQGVAIVARNANVTTTLLNYHVLQGNYSSSSFIQTPMYYPTLFDARSIIANIPQANVTGGQNLGLFRNGSTYQVISGELQTSNVVEANITVGGITIHKIDKVLTLPLNASAQVSRLGATAVVGALTQANLAGTVDTVPDLTIFVPNNATFQAIGSGFTNASMQTLTSVLQYHTVVGNVVFSSDITNTTVAALSGGNLTLTVVSQRIFVNGARVLVPNILLSNGVAHVIDSVLNPRNATVVPAQLNGITPAVSFSVASSVTSVPFTSGVPVPTTTL